jgi:hypothetical protein
MGVPEEAATAPEEAIMEEANPTGLKASDSNSFLSVLKDILCLPLFLVLVLKKWCCRFFFRAVPVDDMGKTVLKLHAKVDKLTAEVGELQEDKTMV